MVWLEKSRCWGKNYQCLCQCTLIHSTFLSNSNLRSLNLLVLCLWRVSMPSDTIGFCTAFIGSLMSPCSRDFSPPISWGHAVTNGLFPFLLNFHYWDLDSTSRWLLSKLFLSPATAFSNALLFPFQATSSRVILACLLLSTKTAVSLSGFLWLFLSQQHGRSVSFIFLFFSGLSPASRNPYT